jgi:hypothetical protein
MVGDTKFEMLSRVRLGTWCSSMWPLSGTKALSKPSGACYVVEAIVGLTTARFDMSCSKTCTCLCSNRLTRNLIWAGLIHRSLRI